MEWYKGSIAEAIASCKSRNCLFVVFVEDGGELSVKMTEGVWNSSGLRTVMGGHIALKLAPGSVTLTQFTQLYQVSSFPSTFIINPFGGRVLDIIVGPVSPQECHQRLTAAYQKLTCGGPASADPAHSLTKEEKVAKAKALIAAQSQKRVEETKQKERHAELDRREAARSVQEFKVKQKEQAAAKQMEDWQKEKQEAAKAKEDIRRKIVQDREDKKRRHEQAAAKKVGESIMENEVMQAKNVPTSEGSVAGSAAVASSRPMEQPQKPVSDEACIQFRLPDGSSIAQTFSSAATVQTIIDFVSQSVGRQWPRFKLVVSYPRQELGSEKSNESLAQLGLSPRAAVMVIAQGSGSSSSVQAASSGIWYFVLLPLLFLQALWHWIVGSGSSSSSSSPSSSLSASSQPAQSPSSSHSSPSQPSRSGSSRGGLSSYQEGRIRRFKNNDDDDDMNTWNGNSTQQQ